MLKKVYQRDLSSRVQSYNYGRRTRSEERSARVPGDAEWAELYYCIGFHPIHHGEIFIDRYRILRNLGHGRFAASMDPMGLMRSRLWSLWDGAPRSIYLTTAAEQYDLGHRRAGFMRKIFTQLMSALHHLHSKRKKG